MLPSHWIFSIPGPETTLSENVRKCRGTFQTTQKMKSLYAVVIECDYPSMPPGCLHIFTLGAVLQGDLTSEYSLVILSLGNLT